MGEKYKRLITFSIPTRGQVDPKFASHMHSVMNGLPTGTGWRIRLTDKDSETGEVMDAATSRSLLVKECLEEDYSKYIFFIDSDVFVPPNAFTHFLQSGKDMVTGIYWTKNNPPQPVIYKDLHMGPYFDFPKDSLFKLDAAGLGCCLIKTDVFRKMPQPWFEYKKENLSEDISEDFYFFIKAKEYGYELWCDSNVQCKHLREDIPQRFYP